ISAKSGGGGQIEAAGKGWRASAGEGTEDGAADVGIGAVDPAAVEAAGIQGAIRGGTPEGQAPFPVTAAEERQQTFYGAAGEVNLERRVEIRQCSSRA